MRAILDPSVGMFLAAFVGLLIFVLSAFSQWADGKYKTKLHKDVYDVLAVLFLILAALYEIASRLPERPSTPPTTSTALEARQ